METETLFLACTANFHRGNTAGVDSGDGNLWKTCTWTRNVDNAACTQTAIDALNIGIGHCDSSMKNVDFGSGNRQECKLSVPSVTLNDRGNWTCRIEECNHGIGGCSTKGSSDCYGEATVRVVVL